MNHIYSLLFVIWYYEKIYFFFYFRITQFQIKYCNNHLMYRCVRSQLRISGTDTNKRHGTNVCWYHHRTTAVYNKCLLLYQLSGIHTQHHRWSYWIKIQTWTVLHVHMEQRHSLTRSSTCHTYARINITLEVTL